MTISGDTVCSVIQAFPVLLILAQNSNRCLKTPLIYKPPTPTHSPEYYEALDALVHTLYGPEDHSHGHGCADDNHGYEYHGNYGYGKKSDSKYYYNQKPCQHKPNYGHNNHGHHSYGYHNYGHTPAYGSHGYGYPVYVNKKNSQGTRTSGTKVYAPTQVHNIKHRYKVVVRKNKVVKKKSASIRLTGFFPPRESSPLGQIGNILNPTRIRNRLSGILHLQHETPNDNQAYLYPFNNRPTQEYGRPGVINEPSNQWGVPNRNNFPDNNNGGFVEVPNQNGYQENGGANPNEEKENGGLIVIPGTNEGGSFNDGFFFPDSKDEVTEATKSIEATTKAQPITEVATPEYSPLTPVPSTDSRNNFNFGPSGIFQETCETVDKGVGSCIQVSECQQYMKLIQQSRSNPDALRLLRQAHCGFQGDQPKVCCPRPGIPTAPPPSPPATAKPEPVFMPDEPIELEAEPKTPTVALPEAPDCGLSNASFSRVVGGVDAKLGDFPWMALLGYKPRRGGAGARWLCGGSLISARHVLTAAHCIHTREEELYVVRLGELDLAREDEGAAPVDVLIQTSIKHQEYNPKAFTNDIGILVLNQNVRFTDLIKPICIPRSSELRARSFENYNPLIAGWGDTEFRGPAATHLQVLQLPVVSNEFCAQAYAAYAAQVIDARVLCAGYKRGGRDACQGDSGGPLMQPIWSSETLKTFFYQIGVVSYGKKCAEAGFPGVYTRVTNFVPWIEETVAKN